MIKVKRKKDDTPLEKKKEHIAIFNNSFRNHITGFLPSPKPKSSKTKTEASVEGRGMSNAYKNLQC